MTYKHENMLYIGYICQSAGTSTLKYGIYSVSIDRDLVEIAISTGGEKNCDIHNYTYRFDSHFARDRGHAR